MAEHRCTATSPERATAPHQQQHASMLDMFYTKSLFLSSPATKSSLSKAFLCSQQPRSCSHWGTSARKGRAIAFLAA